MATGCRRVNIGTAALEQPGLVRAGRSRRTATGWPSASTSAAAPSPPAAGPARAATSTTCWPGSTPRAARATSSPTSTRTACSQGPNLQLLRDVCAATDRPVVASGGVTTLDDIRALMELVAGAGVEGAIAGTALYEGRFSLEDALALTTGCADDARRPRDPVPGRRPRQGHPRRQVLGDRQDRRRSDRAGGAGTTARAPTSSSSTTSPPRPRGAGLILDVLHRGGPARCSSRSPSAVAWRTTEDMKVLLRAGAEK